MSKGAGVFLRTPFNYDRDAASDESGLKCPASERMTKQEFKDETDINVIIRRFRMDGDLPEGWSGLSVDTEPFDLQKAMDQVLFAREAFMELPAAMRARFYNDPVRLMQFLDDPANRDEGIRLGLVRDPVAEKERADAEARRLRQAEIDRAVELDRAVQAARGAPKGG